MSTQAERRDYVAHCASCGKQLVFGHSNEHRFGFESVTGLCRCGRRWSFLFDIDPSGTFSVISFQRDNGDHTTEKKV